MEAAVNQCDFIQVAPSINTVTEATLPEFIRRKLIEVLIPKIVEKGKEYGAVTGELDETLRVIAAITHSTVDEAWLHQIGKQIAAMYPLLKSGRLSDGPGESLVSRIIDSINFLFIMWAITENRVAKNTAM